MQIISKAWLSHRDDKDNALSIFSIDVSPDGSRIATGGLDGKVKLWSAEAFLSGDGEAALQPNRPRQLCSMSTHTGTVTAVRFSPDGRYLASGSDDRFLIIWSLDEHAVPAPVFGSKEVNVESWRPLKRLTGHDNDIQDITWSHNGELLISVGLDSNIIVWSGSSFERLKILNAHKSHVKGVVFDPAGKYFATQSDDRTLKIWRSSDFHLEKTLYVPFDHSPLTTYFRRPSWSPDGANIAGANAMNGPVCSVAIIERGTWDASISLIGHEAPVEVCRFNPKLFKSLAGLDDSPAKPAADVAGGERKADDELSNSNGEPDGRNADDQDAPSEGSMPKANGNKETNDNDKDNNSLTILACAGQDRTLSLWSTLRPRPICAITDIVTKSIGDLCWTPDGEVLFLCSYDGSVVACKFEPGELGETLSAEEMHESLARYGTSTKGSAFPETTLQLDLERRFERPDGVAETKRAGAKEVDAEINATEKSEPTTKSLEEHKVATVRQVAQPAPSVDQQQKVTITKDGRKRVAPTLIQSNDSSGVAATSQANGNIKYYTALSDVRDSSSSLKLSAPSQALPPGGVQALVIGNKRRALDMEEQEDSRENKSAALSNKKAPAFIRPAVVSPAVAVSTIRLSIPQVLETVSVETSTAGITLEVRNSPPQDRSPSRIVAIEGGRVLWTEFVPRSVLLVCGSERVMAVGCEDGSIQVFSRAGRRLRAPLVLEAAPCFLECSEWCIMAITVVGTLYVWDMRTQSAIQPPISIAPVLDSAVIGCSNPKAAPTITQASLTSSGRVFITLSDGDCFVYNQKMLCWEKTSEAWWAVVSHYWDSSGMKNAAEIAKGYIGLAEHRTDMELMKDGRGRFLQRVIKGVLFKEGFESFETVCSIGHLETRLAASELMESQQELEATLVMYARRLAQEANQSKLDELLGELLGPIESRILGETDPGHQGAGVTWAPTIIGLDKHALLRKVLDAIGGYREIQRLTANYIEGMRLLNP